MEKSMSKAQRELQELDGALSALAGTTQMLEERLKPLMAELTPRPSSDNTAKSLIGDAPLTEEVRGFRMRALYLNTKLAEVLERLQI